MIFNDDILFLHVPKTGGLSVTRLLLDVLPKPLWITHPIHDRGLEGRGIVQVHGVRHESLAEARAVLRGFGKDVAGFRLVLVGLRNPYDQEVSRYAYLRRGFHWEAGPEQDLALSSDFATFAVANTQAGGRWIAGGHAGAHPRPNEIRDYYEIDGATPSNLRVLRFERLADDLRAALADLGIEAVPEVPWDNRSDRLTCERYYTPVAEAAVYDRYRWVFDHGWYDRLSVVDADQPVVGSARSVAADRASGVAAAD